MGRPRLLETKNKITQIRFKEKEYEKIIATAKKQQRTPTDLIRIATLKYIDYKED